MIAYGNQLLRMSPRKILSGIHGSVSKASSKRGDETGKLGPLGLPLTVTSAWTNDRFQELPENRDH
jgi:hypothetical protein